MYITVLRMLSVYDIGERMHEVGDRMHGDYGMMGDWWFGLGWFWMLIMWIPLLVIGIVVYHDAEKRNMNGLLWLILVILPMVGLLFLLLYLVMRDTGTDQYENKSARKILDERYARGKISKDEYEDMKKDLQK